MLNTETLECLLEKLKVQDSRIVDVACALFDERLVSVLDEGAAAGLPEGAFGYHLGSTDGPVVNRDLRRSGCALLDPALMPMGNGVVMGEGHEDLKCSHGSCGYGVCPVALAACFAAHAGLCAEEDIPIYSAHKRRQKRAARDVGSFVKRWQPHVSGPPAATRLLFDVHDNDYAGMLVVDDASYLKPFVEDVARILAVMGKIDEGAVEEAHLTSLIGKADPSRGRFKTTGDENLKPRTLYVLDRVGDFVRLESPMVDEQKRYVTERLSHIVDDRYVLLVGTEAELSGFCDLDSRFLHTFAQHKFSLSGMRHEELYHVYLENLDTPLRKHAMQAPEFEDEFRRFVGFNADCMPFKGEELADYLAKHANSVGLLELPTSRYQSSSLEEMLDGIVGLQQVKQTIFQLEKYAMFRKEAEAAGHALPPSNLHMLFTGNPGTGKTTVARIVSTMLYKIGIIRQNKCVEVTAKDLTAKYVGQTDKKTAEVVRSALGGILFIDEAYSLVSGGEADGGSYGRESIAELVKAMEDHRDDLIVIFAGYEKEMAEFVELNPGMASRIGYTFTFEDYSSEQLLEMFKNKAQASGFTLGGTQVEAELAELFDYYRRFKSFGNGRFVDELFQKSVIKHADSKASGYELSLDDVPTKQELFNMVDWSPRSAADMLEGLVGLEDLKKKVVEFEKTVEFRELARREGMKLPDMNAHMLLTGNPGTGKTTVARILASVLYNVGAVPTNKFVEVEANDLSAFQFRSSELAVEKHIKAAMGGVLFVDEAYALMYTRGGDEIVATLVKAMEDHKGEFVVMFAGYKREMREFVELNPGLASRIGYNFHFEDYKPEELQEIFERKLAASGMSATDGARECSRKLFKYFHAVENFGNGRFVDKLLQEAIARHACEWNPDTMRTIAEGDIPSVEDMCKIVSMPVYEPSDVSAEEARLRVAVHEMGHAVCRLALTGATDIMVVTIEQEGNGALGYVQHKAMATALPTAADLENEIVEYMGGMAAEDLRFSAYSAGNSSDLKAATRTASNYVARYGMSPAGYVQYLGDVRCGQQQVSITDLPPKVLDEVNAVMARSFERAKEVITENQDAYDELVGVLMEEGTISGERVMELWRERSGEGDR